MCNRCWGRDGVLPIAGKVLPIAGKARFFSDLYMTGMQKVTSCWEDYFSMIGRRGDLLLGRLFQHDWEEK